MLTKEEFSDCLDFVKAQRSKEERLCEALEALTDGCQCDFLCYGEYEERLLKMLAKAMGDGSEEPIFAFACEMRFGEAGFGFKTAEELYDYIAGGSHE